MNMKKYMSVFLVLVALLLGSSLVAADFTFDEVEVDNIDVLSNVVSVDAGDSIDVDVRVSSDVNADDVRVKVWITGYEYGDLEDKSNEFDMTANVMYTKSLTLEIPEDMEEDDYTLKIEVYDRNDEERETATIQIERAKHKLSILDVLFDKTVDAGDDLDVEVRVENIGSSKEEDIKVIVQAFGDKDSVYIDELVTEDTDDDETSESVDLRLNIPEDASGEYELEVIVEYNDGREELVEVYTVTVDGEEGAIDEPVEKGEVVLNLVPMDIRAAPGEDMVYVMNLANTGSEDLLLNLDVAGVSLWADAVFDQPLVALSGNAVQTVTLTLTPKDVDAGDKQFSLLLKEGNDLLTEVSLAAVVEGKDSVTGFSFVDKSQLLKYGFVGLIVLLVIVGIVVGLRRIRKDDGDDDFPLEPKDGQTYY